MQIKHSANGFVALAINVKYGAISRTYSITPWIYQDGLDLIVRLARRSRSRSKSEYIVEMVDSFPCNHMGGLARKILAGRAAGLPGTCTMT